ncbi:sensor domain-containing diguanylate cyclase [Acinetobacter bohemicus]|uniref:PAS domain S-box-containing protein/diguanylate cyclase (GGDEF) domain-containing protein n=1 Tax=Acinetobacter bohemicus TaxID=1435036 RepID=A0A1I6U2Q4_9GAMM|nr:sensor domain-containing diguanylate cyclase [Acinetobacter bohemicus]KAB0652086.1 sensor domain-containing diguanylate cyclase [Acinetobacter bohemicus]SFS95733.1 PAS domain S-box-containing protein/diguanylate cyclase (GGDEF) domain-containing protein [Acinetobacter bohemicus]
MEILDSPFFELSPIAMWLEDYSDIKKQFDIWREQGVQDLFSFLQEDESRILDCARKIKLLKVNSKTLELYQAKDFEHLCQNLHLVFKGDMTKSHIKELVALWNGETHFSNSAVNYTLTGDRLDIQLKGIVLPQHEHDLSLLLITTEDITPYTEACRLEEKSRHLAEARFMYSPTSLWVEDFSRIKTKLDNVRALGIEDFKTFLDVHSDFINECIKDIVIIDVNQATLDLFGAPNKDTLYKNMHKVFAQEMVKTFREQLIELWNGNIHHHREAINYALDGSIRHVLLQFSVFPDYQDDWGMVHVALTDITARKKAENYLEYLGKHDVLTKLYNRAFYTTEINRLERNMLRPVSCIFMDMNGLKELNDTLGHDVGDNLLQRMGNILNQLVQQTLYSACRIGGDEFVVLLPGADEAALQNCLQSLQELLFVDNQFYSHQPLSLSTGYATNKDGERMEDMLKRADMIMYQEKRDYYLNNSRRTNTP